MPRAKRLFFVHIDINMVRAGNVLKFVLKAGRLLKIGMIISYVTGRQVIAQRQKFISLRYGINHRPS